MVGPMTMLRKPTPISTLTASFQRTLRGYQLHPSYRSTQVTSSSGKCLPQGLWHRRHLHLNVGMMFQDPADSSYSHLLQCTTTPTSHRAISPWRHWVNPHPLPHLLQRYRHHQSGVKQYQRPNPDHHHCAWSETMRRWPSIYPTNQLLHPRLGQQHQHQPRQGPPPADRIWPPGTSPEKLNLVSQKLTRLWTRRRQGALHRFHQWISRDLLHLLHQQHQWSLNPRHVKWPDAWTKSSSTKPASHFNSGFQK